MSSRAARASALQALAARRKGHAAPASAAADDSDSDDGRIYDEVTENEYSSYVRGRVIGDNFIDDDDGSGYVDNGQNEWDRSDDEGSEEDLYRQHYGTTKHKAPKSIPQPSDYFSKTQSAKTSAATKQRSKPKNSTPAHNPAARGRTLFGTSTGVQHSKQDEDDFMNKILNGLDTDEVQDDDPPAPVIRSTTMQQGTKRSHRQVEQDEPSFTGFERFRTTRRTTQAPPDSPRSDSTSATTRMPSSDPMVESPPKATTTPQVRIMQPVHDPLATDELDWLNQDAATTPTTAAHQPAPTKKAKTQPSGPAALDMVAAAIQPDIAPLDDDEDDSEEEGGVRTMVPQGKFERATAPKRNNVAPPPKAGPVPAPAPASEAPAAAAPNTATKLNIDWRQIHEALAMDDDWEADLLDDEGPAPTKAKPSARSLSPAPNSNSMVQKDPMTDIAFSDRESKCREAYYESDGGVYFYWLDHYEQNDKIYLIGKIRSKITNQWESCCITVEGMERCLYVLPKHDPADQGAYIIDILPHPLPDHLSLFRACMNEGMMKADCILLCTDLESARKIREDKLARRARKRRGEDVDDMEIDEEEEQPWQEEVFDEFDQLRSKFGIKTFLSTWVLRDYAFELPDVPYQSRYLKVRYGFDETQLPYDLTTETIAQALGQDVDSTKIARIFGTSTSAFELFLLKRRIMGPCWLRLDNATPRAIRGQPMERGGEVVSWCQTELSVDEPKSVTVVNHATMPDAPSGTPPLKVMSLSVRTVVNFKANQREVLCASARTWGDYLLEDDKPLHNGKFDERPFDKRPSTVTSFVRPIGGQFPDRFDSLRRRQRTKIIALNAERQLLNAVLAHIQAQDPDVIVGHDMIGVSLDVLLHRMHDLKTDLWSRIGRIRRRAWPQLTVNSAMYILSGRLLLDLSSDCSKGMISSTSWSLTEMASTHLGILRDEIDPDETAGAFLDPAKICLFLSHNEMDTWIVMAIVAKLQVLALTKQLTNIAGNSWNRTLNGGRAERNEYILLHDFYDKKYVLPDKITGRERMHAKRIREKHGIPVPQQPVVQKAKRDKFKGGLVFDPKRGLCDKYVLVMDFNSLYPSIIQEFNIDFTTVERQKGDLPAVPIEVSVEKGKQAEAPVEEVPSVPSSDVDRGVLPALIATLVDKRRAVKGLMKDKRATKAQLAQWNVKQLALKLTANSMYGCLGFENSRFYARPLAALTTSKGREILRQTRELAEGISLEVIYGDTDSVMINTNKVTFDEAMAIGREFKKSVNKHYKLLEIDIDAVFERMLLLQKKKYAALKVEDDGTRTKEIKGLDMKRREYCQLSKDASKYVLFSLLRTSGFCRTWLTD